MDLLVAGYFNTGLEYPDRNKCDKAIASAMEMELVEDMVEHLLPSKFMWTLNGHMCSMLCCDQEVRYHTYYILGTDCSLFQNVAARDPRHNTNRYMFLGCL